MDIVFLYTSYVHHQLYNCLPFANLEAKWCHFNINDKTTNDEQMMRVQTKESRSGNLHARSLQVHKYDLHKPTQCIIFHFRHLHKSTSKLSVYKILPSVMYTFCPYIHTYECVA